MSDPFASLYGVSGVSPGTDFAATLYQKLCAATDKGDPVALSRVEILVPTRRMQRRLIHLFQTGSPRLLPRIGLVSDIGHLLRTPDTTQAVPPLKRLLDLKAPVSRLVALDAQLSESSVVDLTESLLRLLDEMHGEAVTFDDIEKLAPGFHSAHWEQSLTFLRAIRGYSEALDRNESDAEALLRQQVKSLCAEWKEQPPSHPLIIAGSTGSRGTTHMLMSAVARLPFGGVILPGFDYDLPMETWELIASDRQYEDHPQYRLATFLASIGQSKADVKRLDDIRRGERNALISLSLRPAPITDQWLSEGPDLGALNQATKGISLVEARDPKAEADAIALAIRKAVEEKKSVALIAPDATLARRVAASLSRWNIVPDDSGGIPLSLTAPGTFMRLALGLAANANDPIALLALLKHPFTRAGEDRGLHMLSVQEFEVFLRRQKSRMIDGAALAAFKDAAPEKGGWIDWVTSLLEVASSAAGSNLSSLYEKHLNLARHVADDQALERIFADEAGEATAAVFQVFRDQGGHDATVTFQEYQRLVERALANASVRSQRDVRSDVMIWGTLEARGQGADVVILGGLNEGTWPKQPTPDPWLNRSMRREVGLLLPERQIGLAAHDYQQAVAAIEVVLTRAHRQDGSETVPSRWLNRLKNLLEGLKDTGGPEALAEMQRRGVILLASSESQASVTVDAAPRPAPAPPVQKRPREYAVTDIKTLITDPYAFYARRILRLKALDQLNAKPDARDKGTAFHAVMERFFTPDASFLDDQVERTRLMEISQAVLGKAKLEPPVVAEWTAHLADVADWLIDRERQRRRDGVPVKREVEGRFEVTGTGLILKGKADRIDQTSDGTFVIYDYKTGSPPSGTEILTIDRQLLLEAVMQEAGAFADLPAGPVSRVVHIGLSRSQQETETELSGENETVTVQRDLARFLARFMEEDTGYLARRDRERERFEGDYDHLSRFGEWDTSQDATPGKLR